MDFFLALVAQEELLLRIAQDKRYVRKKQATTLRLFAQRSSQPQKSLRSILIIAASTFLMTAFSSMRSKTNFQSRPRRCRNSKKFFSPHSKSLSLSRRKTTSTIKKLSTTANISASDSCFVLMPFAAPIGDYYTQIYEIAIKKAGLRPVRADADIFG